jgi:cytochrome o ubiquinol oxidase subunit IV
MSGKISKMIVSKHEPVAGSFGSYVVGFVTSVALTLCAFMLVELHLHDSLSHASNKPIIAGVILLAFAQLLVQLLFFLHLDRENSPRWKLSAFIFMLGVILILVAGSLWIMSNLNYRMTPAQINNYLQDQDNL